MSTLLIFLFTLMGMALLAGIEMVQTGAARHLLPQDRPEAERIARIYLRGMASAFSPATEIWAPRYRQATMGAFLTAAPAGKDRSPAAPVAGAISIPRRFSPSGARRWAGASAGALAILRAPTGRAPSRR